MKRYFWPVALACGILAIIAWNRAERIACGQSAPSPSTAPPVAADTQPGQLILPTIYTRQQTYAATTLGPRGYSNYFQPLAGRDAGFDVDGGQLFMGQAGSGTVRWHGSRDSSGNFPFWMIRVCRDANGSSINGSYIVNQLFTGESNAQLVNDGAEGFLASNCHFQQYAVDGTCVILSNLHRVGRETESRRDRMTCSWVTLDNCGMSVYSTPTRTGPQRGACIRGVGCVTEVKIRDAWFSGGEPAVVLVDQPDESGTVPETGAAWGRWNTPFGWVLDDCYTESGPARQIRLYNYPATLEIEANPLEVTYRMPLASDANRHRIISLRGRSIDNFDVYLGDDAHPLPKAVAP